jgi:hypothetical protein
MMGMLANMEGSPETYGRLAQRSPMPSVPGIWEMLNDKQRQIALSFDGDDTHGPPDATA